MITPSSRGFVWYCIAAPVIALAVLGIALFEPLGPYNIWITLALSFGIAGWALRKKLSGSDEVITEATKTSFAIGAPIAGVISIFFMVLAARFDPLGDYVTGFIEGAAKYNPALTGFAFGICFLVAVACVCVLAARAAWWVAKR